MDFWLSFQTNPLNDGNIAPSGFHQKFAETCFKNRLVGRVLYVTNTKKHDIFTNSG